MKAFKCKKCGTEFPDEMHLRRHEGVHGRKSKVVEFGDPTFSQDRLRG